MVELHRQGESISAISRAIGRHRQTVKAYLVGRREDILTDEIKKQLLTDEQQKHLDDLTQFVASLVSRLTVPDSPTEDRDVVAVLDTLLPKDLPQGLHSASREARRKQRQTERQNKMLFESLRQHTGGKGWWQAFEEWQQAWGTCVSALAEIREEAPKVVEDFMNQKPGLKEKVEEKTGEKDVLERIVEGVIWAAWQVATASNPEEELKLRNFRVLPVAQQLRVTTGPYESRLIFNETEAALAQEVATVCNLALRDLYPRYMVDEILGMIHRMDEKIEEIDDALDPFVLRPLLVRTRCELCPV
jgi:hypothetical protein